MISCGSTVYTAWDSIYTVFISTMWKEEYMLKILRKQGTHGHTKPQTQTWYKHQIIYSHGRLPRTNIFVNYSFKILISTLLVLNKEENTC
jgi:hypothetical protein